MKFSDLHPTGLQVCPSLDARRTSDHLRLHHCHRPSLAGFTILPSNRHYLLLHGWHTDIYRRRTPTITPPSSPGTSSRPTPTNTEVISLAWFHLSLARDKFLSRLVNRPMYAREAINIESIQAENMGFIEYLLRSHCGKLLDLPDLGTDHDPQLVRMFYANLRTIKTSPIISLESQMKHTKLTVTESELNAILNLPHNQGHPSHLSYLILK